MRKSFDVANTQLLLFSLCLLLCLFYTARAQLRKGALYPLIISGIYKRMCVKDLYGHTSGKQVNYIHIAGAKLEYFPPYIHTLTLLFLSIPLLHFSFVWYRTPSGIVDDSSMSSVF